MKRATKFVAVAIAAALMVPAFAMTATPMTVDAMSLDKDLSAADASNTSGKKDSTGKISTNDFEILVEFGLMGNVKPGTAIPVLIGIESLTKDFEGTARIIVPTDEYSSEDGTAYETGVMLTQGSKKNVSMSVYNAAGVNYIYFQLLNEKGKVVIEKRIRLNEKTNDKALVGILSDDYTALNYFDQRNLVVGSYYGDTQLVELDADKLPEQASGLGVLSYLIINSFDTQKLSGAQMDAIEGYVRNGGILIVGTGPDYQQTTSNLDADFVPISVDGYTGGTLEVDTYGLLSSYVYNGQSIYDKEAYDELWSVTQPAVGEQAAIDEPITTDEEVSDQDTAIGDAAHDAATTEDVTTEGGTGNDDVVSFDASQGIINMTLDNGNVLDGVVTQDNLIWLSNYGKGNVVVTAFNLGMEPVNSWDGKSDMATSLLMAAAQGYSGERMASLNYGDTYISSWTIRNTLSCLTDDKKPWYLILIGSMLLFIISCPVSYIILKVCKKPMAIWFVIPMNASVCTAIILVSTIGLRIHAPAVSTATIMMQEGDDGETISQDNYSSILVSTTKLTEVAFDDKITDLRILENDDYYYGENTRDERKFSTIFREDAQGYEVGFVNKNTFEREYLTFHSAAEEENKGLDTEFSLSLSGIRGTIVNNTGYDLSHVLVYDGEHTAVEIGELKKGASASFDETDNENMYYISVPGITNYYDKQYHIINSLYEMVYDSYMYNSGAYDNKFYVVGYVEDYHNDYISSRTSQENNEAVFVKSTVVTFDDYEGAKMLSLFDYATYNSDWDSYDGQLYANTVYADFYLSGVCNNVVALVNQGAENSYMNVEDTDIYAYNYQTGEYDLLFVDSDCEEFPQGCPYLSEGRQMSLRFECPTTYDCYVPKLVVVGGN